MARKHKLTKKTDHIDGNNGKDLFLAPMFEVKGHERATLSNKDVLNGRGGIDTISAFIAADSLTPRLRNIEKAVFTRHETSDLTLDLARATRLSSIVLKNFDADVNIAHAGRLGNFTLKNVANAHEFSIDGINTTKVENVKLSFNTVMDSRLDMQTVDDAGFKAVAVSLRDSSVTLSGDLAAEILTVHSNGVMNQLKLNDGSTGVKHIVADGAATLALGPLSSDTLESFDAAAMTGKLAASIGGVKLLSIAAGNNDDSITLTALAGAVGEKAIVELGAGDDQIDLAAISLDADLHAIDGGLGHDKAFISGNIGTVSSTLLNFEHLVVDDASGDYNLAGSGIASVTLLNPDSELLNIGFLYGAGAQNDMTSFDMSAVTTGVFVDVQSSNLVSVTGSAIADNMNILALGGSAGNKAMIELGDGDDFINLRSFLLNGDLHHVNGGNGDDSAAIIGNLANVAAAIQSVETLLIDAPTGSYDLSGSGVTGISLGNFNGAFALNGLASGTEIKLLKDAGIAMSFNVENAAASQDETLFVGMYFGTSAAGSMANGMQMAGLSNLELGSAAKAHEFYLGALGGADDLAKLTISGSNAATVFASTGSDIKIGEVIITNSAGANILGLGEAAFDANGISITGGAGNDVLIGGAGLDLIQSGGGNNVIHGSLGGDHIILDANPGNDVLVFNNAAQSNGVNSATVSNFGSGDAFDLSAMAGLLDPQFAGVFADYNSGLASLSMTASVAFFETGTNKLIVDINHDGVIDPVDDFQIQLSNTTSLDNGNFIF